MKAFQIGSRNGIDALTATMRAEPVAGRGEVVVAPRLVGMISRDLQLLRGTYGGDQPATRIPMSEGVGTVVSVGDGVTEVKAGDRVVCGHFSSWLDGGFRQDVFAEDIGVTRDGWLAEKVVLPAPALIRVPDGIADENVAGLASAALTAWHALTEMCHVKPGDLVLCLGTGSVSLAAMKIAKAHGARVAITSSQDEKLDLVRTLGADITINYRTSADWAAELMAETGGAGADIVIETGGVDTLGHSIAACAVNGQIVVVGVSPGKGPAIPDYLAFIAKNLTIRGIANGSRAMFVDLLRFIEAKGLDTIPGKTFAFVDAPEAYRYFAAAEHLGKVMIKF